MNSNILSSILQSLFSQLPVLLVALVACIVTVLNWQQSPSASMFSLAGFGLTLVLCLAIPVTQIIAVNWMMPSPGEVAHSPRMLLTALSFFWAVLRAASYCFLLAAIYTGRSAIQSPSSSTPPTIPR